jgi:hypothetical protein
VRHDESLSFEPDRPGRRHTTVDTGPARRVSLTVAVSLVLAVVLAASLSLASTAGALTQHATARQHQARHPDLVKTAHVPLGNCTATDVVMRALIPRLTYSAGQPVTVAVVVHNVGSHTCTFGGTGHRYPEYIGPCGAFPLQVFSGGAPDWPGPIAYSCPLISATTLAPGAQLTATGTWPKAIATRTATSRAPAGIYRLTIDQAITFTITLR